MRISLFNSEKAKKFQFQSRYYDAEKEERERRHRRYNKKSGDNTYNSEELRQELKYRWNLKRESNLPFNQKVSSVKRIILIIVILICVLALLYLLGMLAYNLSI